MVRLRSDAHVLAGIRRALLWTLLVAMIGTGTELLLLGHVEGAVQRIPLVLLGVAVLVVAAHAVRPSATTVRAVQATMAVCVAAGVAGVAMHYRGNLEFELEMYPTMGGRELVEKVVTGATPVLAPASLSLLGVIGWLHAYGHPALMRAQAEEERQA